MTQAEGSHRFCDTIRFPLIHWKGPSRLDGAIVTAPGADVAENKERRGAGIPTFPPVRTAGFFADRVELKPLHGVFDIEIIGTSLGPDLEPGGKAGSAVGRGLVVDD
jgi:hypothetical protein